MFSPTLLRLALGYLLSVQASAWISPRVTVPRSTATASSSTALFAILPENYQAIGNEIIFGAAKQFGATEDQIEIQWKGGKIIVVVKVEAVLSVPEPSKQANDASSLGDADGIEEGEEDDNHNDDDDDNDDNKPPSNALDIVQLARAINHALDDGDVGLRIAESHAVEVTTPGAPEEISGVMWTAYKGFDVIAEHRDPKLKKIKRIEGRLHDRTSDFTVINIKGRMKKLKNENVISVKLPKAKKE